jgi:hypothetical protein
MSASTTKLPMAVGAILLSAACLWAQQPRNDSRDSAWIEKRAADWQPTREERAFEDIGWASTLTEAEALAKKHGRAIFLFTYDGENFAGYRC